MQTDNRNMDLVTRFIGLPLPQRKLFLEKLALKGMSLAQLPIPVTRQGFAQPPLSYAQQRQWFLWQLEPQSAAYNLPAALKFSGDLDITALQRSFEALIARHETLRTTFRLEGEQAVQVIHPHLPFELTVEPMASANDAAVQARLEAEAQLPFDLEHGPLLRATLLQLGDQEQVLALTLHHIVSDGWSMPVMVDDLVRFYASFSLQQQVQLPALAIQYADYAIWQRAWMEAGEQERQLDYWKAQLGDQQPVLELPTDRPRPAVYNQHGARLEIPLAGELVGSLKQLAQQRGVTPFMLLLASFQTLLHRYSGQADIRVGVPVANRNRVETERLMGFFVNTQVLRAEFDLGTTFMGLLEQVKARALGAQAHQDLPFEQLVEVLQPERSLSHSPLFQVMYNHQTQAKKPGQQSLPGLAMEELALTSHVAKFDLALDTFEHEGGISAALTFATDLFDLATIERMAQHWLNLLVSIVTQPDQRVADLAMLGQHELRQVIRDWNDTQADYPVEQCMQQLFEAQVKASPSAPALLFEDQVLSYKTLNQRANQLAHKLRDEGVGPDVLVGIAMQRSPEMVIGLLAILKAGGAYVPLDPDYPQDRLEYMLQDSQAIVLLSQSHLLARMPEEFHSRTLLVDQLSLEAYPDSDLSCINQPSNLAYSIYTSGSTGKPKGVLIEHRNVTALIGWALASYSQEDLCGVLASTSICFDLSVWELFVTLSAGGYAVLAANALELPHLAAKAQVRLINTVPSAIKMLHETGELPEGVHTINLAGEALKQSLVDDLYATGHVQRVYDLYGPSEDTTYSTFTLRAAHGKANIGRPISNSAVYLLSEAVAPVPVGVVGELYMAGAGLARGYLGRPGLTAERFLPDPFDQQGGGRMYRTGDLARYQNDGLIEYAGRIDHQVKIRGFRIELGEIEARLQAQETVREAVLLAQDGPTGKQLVGYVVPADDTVIATPAGQSTLREALRGQLKQSLPEYMVPSQLLFLEKLPLTPNGKLDRKALPKPDASQFQAQFVAPRSELERDIAAVWANVLKLERVGITDNFFELGGDSIISLQVVSRARQAGIQFTPKQLFQHQTVQGLASVARRADSVAIDQGAVTGVLPLTPVQHWFFEQSLAQPHHWNQSVLLAPGQTINPQHLQAALQAVLQQHDALRLGFGQVEGNWQGSFNSVAPQEVLWERAFSSLDELQLNAADAQRSFTLSGPLLRAVLGTLPDGTQRLLLVVHHLVVDGVSWRVLLEDLQKAYLASATDQPLQLPAKTSSFQAWSERLQAYGKSVELATEMDYWQAELKGVDDSLPCDRAQGGNLQRHAAYASTSLDREWTDKLLHESPSAYRTQINDLLLTALARVVSRWTGRSQVLVRLEGHGREDVFDGLDLTRTVGWFTSIYPVRLSAHGELDKSIKTIKEQLRAVPDKGIGYGVLRYLGSDHSRHVLQQLPQGEIVFNYLGQFDGVFQEEANLFTPAKESGGANYSEDASLGSLLAINGQVYAGELKLGWTFSRERFDVSTIQRLADEYAEELKTLISHCCQADQCGVTPSDFPLANLSQAQLDSLPVPTADIADVYPLAPMQSGMLFHTLYEQSTDNYINQMRVDVEGLDVERFTHAWQGALNAHAILRTCFVWQGTLEQAVQVVLKHVELPFVEHDWRNQPAQEQALQALADGERQRGFDVSSAPLLRLVLVRTGENRHHLMCTHHHILMDGWSTSRLLGEVLQRYAGHASSNQATHYRDYIAWLQRQPSGAAEHFWKSQLAELQEPTRLALAVRKPGNAVAVGQQTYHQVFDQEQTASIEAFARANRVTVNTLVQSAWLLLLQRYTGQPTVAFGATVAGRPADLPGVEEQIGLFINTLPVVGSPRAEQTVAEWIAQVQAANLAAREYEHTPLNDVQRWAGLSGESLFDSLLVFENYPVSEALQRGAPDGLRFGEVANHEQTNYPLTVLVNLGATLSLQYNHDQAHWGQPAVCQVAEHFGNLLRALTIDATQPIGDLLLAGQQEQLAIVHDWNRSQAKFPSEYCIHTLIEAQAEASPHAVAICFGGQTLSYDALNRRANRLAHRLREAGVGPDVLVGLAVERSFEMVVGLLGILKAGGAYVPLDPESPKDRLAYQFEDSGIGLLLTQGHLHDGLPIPPGLRCVSLDDQTPGSYSEENPSVAMSPQNLAYVIYTSGSTGKPKGALLTHHNVLRLFAATQDWFQFDASDVWTVFHSYAFDFSVWELYGALLYGGRAVIVPKDVARSSQDFHALLLNEQVTVLNQTPSAFQQLVPIACEAAAAGSQLALRHVVFGGEALDVSSLKPWFDVFGECQPRMINMYGITETTVHVTYRPINRSDLKNVGSSPIGEVIPDLSWYLLDGSLNPVVPGSQGELMIGQDGLARGYHGRPALTAERFVPNPFDQQGGRLYRSGDLARYAEQGVIEYLGRIDHQVKIRGFRIELGEIEARLQEHEAVRQAVVLAQDGPSGKQLVAYVVPTDATVSDSLQTQAQLREALREALRVNLPDYMVPAHLLFLPSLPLTGNGKLDRRALPKPDASLLQGEYVAPQSVLEQQIAGVWADVLKLDKVGLSDNFFELGGDSIISLQVVSRARQLDIQFTPKELFQNQTVQALAAVARRAASTMIEQGPVSGSMPLLPIQQWFFEADIAQRHHWNQSVMLVPSEPLQRTLLSQALQALVLQHDALRLRFEQGNAGWSGTFSEAGSDVLWHREVADTQALQALACEAQRSLDLQQGQLVRAVLVECADGSQRLLLVIHHLVVDGVSWRVLLEDLQQAYQALRSGQPLKLQSKTTSVKAWAEQLQGYATSAALQAELGYWQMQLQGTSDALPCDRPQGSNLERHAASVSTRLDRELTRQLLQEAPAAYRTQINDLLLTALARVISRWIGRNEVLVRLEGHGREDLFEGVDLSRTVGWFTSMYPVRLSPQAGLVDSLKTIKEQLRAVPNKGLGHGLLRYLGDAEAQATLAALPRGEIVFNYLGQFDASFDEQAGLFVPAKEYAGATQDEDAPLGSLLALNGQVYGGELKLGWSFSREVFDEATVQRLADDYAQELALLIAHCSQPQHRGVTPSDFPLAALTQAQLDNLPVAVEHIADVYPLSPMQQGMLFHTLYEQQAGDYINQMRVDVQGLDVERFRQAWQAAVDSHAILRSGFIWQGELNQAVQVVHKQVSQALVEHDWRGQPALEQALQTLAEGDRQAGFALDQAPLQRLTVVRTAEDSHHLIYTNHHILMDGWSTSRLLGEVLQRYAGRQPAAQVAPYRDYIAWLQRQDAAAAQAFWQAQLAPLEEPTRLAQVVRRSATPQQGQGEHYQVFDRAISQRIETFARANRVTVNTLVQSAWLLLLQRYTGQPAVCFGATVAGRPADLPGVEEQIGLFINTLPVIAAPRSEQTVAEWIAQVQASNLALRDFEHTPLNDVQRWAGLGGEALFDSLLVFENYPVSQALQEGAPDGLRFGPVANLEQTNYPLTLAATLGDTLALQYSHNRAMWDDVAIQRLAEHFGNLLRALVDDAAAPIGELPMLGDAERQQVLHDWNQSQAITPSGLCAHQLFEAQVRERPDALALVFGEQQLTYRELDLRTNRLANLLVARGVAANSLVGVAAERGLALAVALIAIHKAGAAYVPLDPEYPQDRLAYLIQDSGIGLLLGDAAAMARMPLPTDLPCIELQEGEQWLQAFSDQPLPCTVTLDSLAYVIYTSGSTGMPKGVAIAHQALSVFCEVASDYSRLTPQDRVLQFATFSFDGFIEQFFPPLSRGACVVMRGQQLWDTETFSEQVIRHGITVADLPAAYWRLLALDRRAAHAYGQLKQIHVGGEAVALDGLQAWLEDGPAQVRLLNTYGPTEATVVASTFDCSRLAQVPAAESGVPIGRALAGRVMLALDDSLSPTPVGVAGELYIGGDGCLARGYHQRPSLTAERFIPDPLSATGGARLYRTGDLGCFDEQGELAYRGRADHQVKVRGFRIELGEIEQHLQAHPHVRQAAVVAIDHAGGKQLCGYVVADDPSIDAVDLRAALKQSLQASLPDYMVPTYLMVLEEMPMTPSGKLDRKRLPGVDPVQSQGQHVAPQTALEQQLADIWASVLKVQQVGVTDNFFELGGDSIISLQVVSRARQAGIQVTPKQLFQHQTVQALAAVAGQAQGSQIDQGPVIGTAPLTPIQQWFFEERIPERHHWNQAVMLAASEPLQVPALEAALQVLVAHHDALRLNLTEVAGSWQAAFAAPGASDLLWVREVQGADALRELANQAQRSLDLAQGPLLRAVLASLADGSQRLLLVIHHLVVDGVSWRVLLEDLQQAYQALAAQQPVELPAKTSSFKAWAEHLQHYAQGAELQQQLGYWQGQLQGMQDTLPCDHPHGGNLERHATSVSTRLDAQWTRQLLQDAPAAYRTQINDLLLTALARVVGRWTAQADVLVRLEGHGREDLFDDVDLSRTVGWFTSLYPVKLSPQADLAESLKTIKEQLRAIPDKGIGYGVLRYLGNAQTRQVLEQLPQGQIVFNYLGQFDGSFDADAALLRPAQESPGQVYGDQSAMGSLLAVNGQVYGGELRLNWSFSCELFDTSTIARLADDYAEELKALIAHCCASEHRGITPSDVPLSRLSQVQLDALPVAASDIADVYPLSPMQQGMLFHTLYEQGKGDYINQMRVDVEGLDSERFKQAWRATLAAHDILRSGFVWQGDLGQAVQVVRKQLELPFSEYDWRAQPQLQQALQALAEGEYARGFELEQAPLLRLVLVRTGADSHHLIFTNHHILLDGWSTSRLLGEVLQRYAGQVLPTQAGRYRDYIAWLQRQDGKATEAFWLGQLAGLQEPTRLAQAVRGLGGNLQGQPQGEHYQRFDAAMTQQINAFARASRVTVNTLVQSAWLLLLQRYTGQPTVCFGATVAGRPAQLPGVEEQIGLFINTLPVMGAPRAEQSVAQWIEQVQASNLEMREFEHTPLYDVQRWAGLGGEALFDSLLVFENYPVAESLRQGAPGGLAFGPVANLEQTNYPMTVEVSLSDTLNVHYSHDLSLLSVEAVGQIAENFATLLQALILDATAPIGELPLLSLQARRTLLEDWNPKAGPVVNGPCAHQLFQSQAALRPEAVALVFDEQSLTYAELDRRTNQLAHKLRAEGVGVDTLVGVAAERGLALAVALLAIHKAGGAYVPLDPEFPQDRLAYMINDSGMSLLLADAASLQRLPVAEGLPCIALEAGAQWLAEQPCEALDNIATGQSLAYVIYTSGSTGMPKGVAIAHQALSVFCDVASEYSRLSAADRVLQFATFSFDGFIEQFFPPLSRGACVVMRDQLWDVDSFFTQVKRHRVTVADLPAAYWRLLALERRPAEDYASLKQIHVGGEAVAHDGMRAWLEDGPQAVKLVNTYGPTEATVVATTFDCARLSEVPESGVPIGRAITGRTLHALDDGLLPTPVGVAGELFIGGAGCLARGYHQRPSLTAERFVPDPFDPVGGGRLYRTGDLGYFDAAGEIAYRGRADHQVKVRGFRIELGEIEQHLQAHPLVREAAVLAQDLPSGKQLCGYVVGHAPVADDLRAQLKAHLQASLPEYMVPAVLMLLEHMPLTPSGKLDRKALPAADFSQVQHDYVAPQSALEQQLAEIWASVLKLAQVGINDNFFELGGDSIISLQVVSRARKAGIQITPKQLFHHQTVQALAAVASQVQGSQIDQGPVTGVTPLTPIQQWFFEEAIPQRHHWNQSLMLTPSIALNPPSLTAALHAVIDQHDALRLRFAEAEHGWQASFGPAPQAVLWQREARDAAELLYLANQAQTSLDLTQGELLRAVLATLADGSQRLLLVAHHLVVDGVSWRVLLEDLQQAYQALAAQQPLELPAKTSSFKAWAEHLQAYASRPALEQALGYWQAQLQGASDSLPCDHPEGANVQRCSTSVRTALDAQWTRKLLQDAPAAFRTQINDVLLTALARVIGRWTGQADVLVRLEGHGREDLFDDVDLSRTVGWFTSLYPVRLTPQTGLVESLKTIKEQLRAIPDKGIGYGVLRYLGSAQTRRVLEQLPQGEIVFNYLGQFDASFDEEAGLFAPASENPGPSVGAEAPLGSLLALNGQVYAGELQLDWSFSQELFEVSTIQRLADDLTDELKALIACCCEPSQRGVTPSDFPLAKLSQAQLDALPVDAAQIADLYPLSPMQQGMLFYALQGSEDGLYITQSAVEVAGLELERFVEAWQRVIARHDILRTGFVSVAPLSDPLQVVYRQVTLPVRMLDWQAREVCPAMLEALKAQDAAEGFALEAAPLMRLTLVRLDEHRVHLVWTSHHILMDGWSSSQLLAEVLQTYHGKPSTGAARRYRDYIHWLGEQPQAQLEQFWTDKLRPLESATLLAGSIAPHADAMQVGHDALYLNWDAERTRLLREQAQRLRVTPNTLIQAAWLLLLQRYTGQPTVCFGATVAGRPASLAGADEMLGLFINTLPVVQTPQPQQRVSDWLQALQAYNLELRDHEHAALADVQRWAGRPGQPLFDSIVVFENFPVDERLQEGGGGNLRFGEVSSRDVTNYAMDLAVHLTDTFSVEFLYLRGSFTEAAADLLRGSFERLLEAMLDQPEATLGSLDVLTPAQAALCSARNRLQAPAADKPLLAARIAAHAQARPDAVAVICAEQQLSYAELDQRANRLAHLLLAQGVRPETTVGIALERSVEVIVAFLAVMKTGAAYVPLDIDYPPERLQWIVEDSAMHLLITSSALRPRFAQVQRCIALDQQAVAHLPTSAPQVAVQPDNLAYLIYTSGSTGKPKGVAVSHGQISMHCEAIAGLYEMDASTRELLFMSFAFDGAQERWLSTLSSGGCLVVRDNRLWTAEETFNALHAQRIDIACFPPAYLQQLAEYAESQAQPAPAVRIYCFGGDAVADALFEQVKRTLRPQWLTNGYGPTETVVTPLLWKVAADQVCEAVYAPIGERVGERTLHVLDADLNPLPDGVAGELYIGGEGVARGYHQRAGLTGERFVADPFGEGTRLYRTGDRVRRRANGVIDFIGRLDTQLKIRGFRIEPGEIEARLRNLEDVRDAVVVGRDVASGKQLIGYVVTSNPAVTAEQLRETLRAELPDYMVPAQLVLMAALPLTANGKVDRQGLPAPDFTGQRQRVAPRNAIEQALAAIWQEVLEVPSVGVEDNFFELGGDSLRVLKMLSKVRADEALPIELKLRDVIARPTIGELSGYTADAGSLDPLLPLNSRVAGVTPLFCLHAGFGTVFDYEPLARRLEGRCTVYGLQCRMLLDHGWEDDSIQSMAIDYAQYIRQKQPEGPYQLAGWSLGGTLAVLVAQELESQGQQVALLGLVDSFVPSATVEAPSPDWSADLRGFLGVILDVACDDLQVPAVAAGSSQAVLEAVIEQVRITQAGHSAYAGISTAELAHTFIVAMRLKVLSQQMGPLPQTQVRASCWWAGEQVDETWIAGSALNVAVAAGHYDILRQLPVLEGLMAGLRLQERVSE